MANEQAVGRPALDQMLRHRLGPHLRALNFKGSKPTWRLTNEFGDTAVLSAQVSQWGSFESSSFIVNMSLTPGPYWEWQIASGEARGKLPSPTSGLNLGRLSKVTASPAAREVWWHVTTEATADAAADDLLSKVDNLAMPLLRNLMTRPGLLQELEATGVARAVRFGLYLCVLSDYGPSDRFDRERARVLDMNQGDRAPQLVKWAEQRMNWSGSKS